MRYLTLLAGLALAAQLAGCGDSNGAPAQRGEAARPPYHIVTVTRPDSPEKLTATERGLYEVCAERARQAQLQVKPFPALPKDYFFERQTWVSDGKTWMTRDEHYGLDTTALVPEKGCATRFAIASLTQVRRDGKMRSVEIGFDGERTSGEEPANPVLPPDQSEAGTFTVAKTVAGHKVRCMPPGGPAGATDVCVADGDGGLPVDADGRAIVVHMRTKNAQGTTDLVTEPQTVRVGGRIEKGAFGDAGTI